MLRKSTENKEEISDVGSYILDASKENNLALVKELLCYADEHKQNWDQWHKSGTRNFAIHFAVKNENLEMVKLLIKSGVNICQKNAEGKTPLILALEKRHTPIVAELLKYDTQWEDAGSYILDAAKENNLILANELLAYAREHDDKSWTNWKLSETRNFAIHFAVKNENLEMVKLFIKSGVNICQKNAEAKTPLILALETRNVPIVAELLKYDTDFKETGSYILDAAKEDNLMLAKELLLYAKEHKQSWNDWQLSETCNTSLHLAVKNQNIEMVRLLLTHGADVHKKNKAGETPYLLALKSGNAMLILSFIKPSLKNDIHLIEIKSAEDLFNVDLKLIDTKTFMACLIDIMRINQKLHKYPSKNLEEKKIDEGNNNSQYRKLKKKLQSFYDQAALEQAIQDNNLAGIKLLLNHELLNQVLCKEKLTPLEVAIKYHKTNIAEYLILQGAKIRHAESKMLDALNQYQLVESTLDSTIKDMRIRNKYTLNIYKKMLPENREIEISSEEREFFILATKVSLLIDTALEKLKASGEQLKPNEAIDLSILVCGLLSALEYSANCSKFEERIKLILSEREGAILNSSLDYCYAAPLIANQICYDLVKTVFNTDTPENILLSDACIKDRFGTLADVEIISEDDYKEAKKSTPEYGNYTLILGKDNFYIRTANFANDPITILFQTIQKDEDLKYLVQAVATLTKNKKISELNDEKDQEIVKNIKQMIKLYHTRAPAKWFDPAMGIEETTLPNARDFFRTPGNEIHLYRYVVNQAIIRLKDNNKLLEHIWFGTDPKNITPVPPLTLQTLALLKQKSPTLKKLIDYTESLDKYFREIAESNVFSQFEMLKNGLFAGNYRVTKSHEVAGDAAYIAIAKFADWWNRLKKRRPDLCQQIRSLNYVRKTDSGNEVEIFGFAIDILFDQSNLNNDERIKNANYCIHLKANRIERLLQNESICEALRSIQLENAMDLEMEPISTKTLDIWEDKINVELQQKSQPIVASDFGQFPTTLNELEITGLMLKGEFIQSYKDIFVKKEMKSDAKRLIKYIISEKNNKNLESLYLMLSNTEFDYLRKHDEHSPYYAYVSQQRVQTSQCYALIQEAISERMIFNITKNKGKSEAHQAVTKLCHENQFIKYKTKGSPYKIFSNFNIFNKTPTLFNGYKNVKESKDALQSQLAALEHQAMRL